VRLLLDQNLSRVLVRRLAGEYPESVHVAEIGLDTATDREIWEYAGEHGYVVVSKDSDFRQLALLYGPPPHVVWLRVGNVPTHVIETLLRRSVERLEDFGGSGEESLLVLSLGG
jgi:predicted nuclease of predicted toxin-antitoxin system